MKKTLYIVNPTSNGGTGIRVWNRFQQGFTGQIPDQDVRMTTHIGHAGELAASETGYDVIVAVGGDGTVGEVISGIMARPPREDSATPVLGILPAGTGNDVARHMDAFPLEKAISALQGNNSRTVDLIRVDCEGENGPQCRHAFLYGTGGFSALVKFKPWMKRYLGSTIGTYVSMILALMDFNTPRMTVKWGINGKPGGTHVGPLWMAIVANADKVGGASVHVAPGAKVDDGMLDMLLIPSKPKLIMLATVLPKIPNGRHIGVEGVKYFRGTEMTMDAEQPVLVEVDGDVYGYTPATFKICPSALQIVSG